MAGSPFPASSTLDTLATDLELSPPDDRALCTSDDRSLSMGELSGVSYDEGCGLKAGGAEATEEAETAELIDVTDWAEPGRREAALAGRRLQKTQTTFRAPKNVCKINFNQLSLSCFF